MKRIQTIDITRGIVMIIMALDHVRDLMHVDSIAQSPTNLTTTNLALFFTRWITYLCAPIFVFLAGTSVYLSLKSSNNIAQTKALLLKRGLWLILLEFTVVNFGLYFDIGFHTILFEVIASTGFGFILLSFLLNKTNKQIAIIGLLIILLHNLTPLIPFGENSISKIILTPFFAPTAFPLFAGKIFIMGYPPIPWFGIMLVGFATGHFFSLPPEKTKPTFLKIGMIAIGLFVLTRLVNIYGDPSLWSIQKNGIFSFLSFMNISKYPPSLDFCLITLGIMFLKLGFVDQLPVGIKKVFLIYGRVPLFYFIVHFYLVHLITLIVLFFQGFHWSQMDFALGSFGRPKEVVSGLSLGYIYIIWIVVVLVMYQPCVWFGNFKASNNHWWLKYI
jgi:uncharacterized membrane protein